MIKLRSVNGFTLIELSIVLVIIGLITGGVLVGRDLIRAAELQHVISTLQSYQTAVVTFKLKYNALPGDMMNAEQFWGSDINCPNTPAGGTPGKPTCNGNGDGLIGGMDIVAAGVQSYEVLRVWQQLGNAELIAGSYSGTAYPWGVYGMTPPGTSVPDTIRIRGNVAGIALGYAKDLWGSDYALVNGHHVFNIGTSPSTVTFPYAFFFTPSEAYRIDSKIDDGKPFSGTVSGTMQGSGIYWCGNEVTNIYQPDDFIDDQAVSTFDRRGCSLYLLGSF